MSVKCTLYFINHETGTEIKPWPSVPTCFTLW